MNGTTAPMITDSIDADRVPTNVEEPVSSTTAASKVEEPILGPADQMDIDEETPQVDKSTIEEDVEMAEEHGSSSSEESDDSEESSSDDDDVDSDDENDDDDDEMADTDGTSAVDDAAGEKAGGGAGDEVAVKSPTKDLEVPSIPQETNAPTAAPTQSQEHPIDQDQDKV